MFCVILNFWLLTGSTSSITSVDEPNGQSVTTNMLTSMFEDLKGEIKKEVAEMWREAHLIREEGYNALEKAYLLKDQMYASKDEDFAARIEMQSALVEAFSLIKSQVAVSSLYIEDIKHTH